jgi:hypothetical protein
MAFPSNTLTQSFKVQFLTGIHDFTVSTGHVFKMALYDNTTTMTAATATYPGAGVNGELAATGNYTQGGNALTNALTPAWNTTGGAAAITDFDDEVWATATFTARGALIYNTDAGASNATVALLNFGSDKSATAGDFTVQFPTADAATAIIRVA